MATIKRSVRFDTAQAIAACEAAIANLKRVVGILHRPSAGDTPLGALHVCDTLDGYAARVVADAIEIHTEISRATESARKQKG